MSSSRSYILWSFAFIAGLVALAVLWPRQASTPAERRALAEKREIITYWDRHFGHEYLSRLALMEEFNASQSEVYIRSVPIGYNALMEKTLTAIAGGAPPDLCSMDGGILSQLASDGLFLPLEDFMAEVPSLHEEEFMPHVWRMVAYNGHVWGIPTTTDTYCLLWNKAAFRRAGLDPDQPPRTLKELEEFAARLTIRSATGSIDQMGFLPWLPWDQSYMWGLLFGGLWYNENTGWVETARDQRIIASFAWQQSFTIDPNAAEQLPYAMDPERIAAFTRSIGDYMSASNPFYSGKVAMISEGEWQVTFIPKYAPGLEWGVAPLPQPEGAPPIGYGPTCVTDVIPITSRHPDAAKKYLRWFYSPRPGGRPSPASDYNYAIHNIPCRRNEALQDRFMENPKFRVFVEQLLTKPVSPFPVTPITQFLTDQIERQRERVTFRKITPEQAAKDFQNIVNRELARVRTLLRRREGNTTPVEPPV